MAVKQTVGRDALGEFAPKFAELNDDVLFGQVWSREDKLSLRDRSLVTVVALMAQGLTDESGSMIFGTVTEQVGQQMENTEDIQVIQADRQEVHRILRQERVSMRCGLMLMQFLKAETEAPFDFLHL